MQNQSDNGRQHIDPLQGDSKTRQQQSDPQKTELKGFVDPKEELEPVLQDGTKAPEKAPEENRSNGNRDAD